MEQIITIGKWLLPLLYLALVIDYGASFILRVRPVGRGTWLLAVAGLHALYLALLGVYGNWGLLAGPYAIPSVVALSMVLVYAIVELATRDRRTGVFVLALAFLFQYTSSMFLSAAAGPAEPTRAESAWGGIHVIPALLSYTALALASVYGLLYLLVRRGLKRRRFGVLFDRLPPLEMLGKMSWHALLTGFAFMTVAIITAGVLFGAQSGGQGAVAPGPKVMAKIVTGSVAWVIYAAAIFGKLFGKWSLARISMVALAGFVVVLLLLVASGIMS